MCGIFGVVYNDRSFSISDEWLRKTLRTMAHRGPDDEGVLIQGHVGLAHRRLSIIDLSGGHQPMSSDDGVLSVTFNGEIYNYQEIRAELIVKGYCFKSESDTEVILHAYREYGTDCLKKFRGMFAFALYDRNQDILFLARDRFGKKPLYYYVDGQVFAFSSEVKGLLGSGLAKSRVNMKAMDFYLSLGYVPAPLTMFEGISKLNPGCYLLLKRGRLSIHEYWKLEETRPQSISFPVPIASWFKGELYEPVYDLLMDHKTRCQNYFKPSYVETMLKNHKAGRQDMSRRIFSLLTLELWHRLYVDP